MVENEITFDEIKNNFDHLYIDNIGINYYVDGSHMFLHKGIEAVTLYFSEDWVREKGSETAEIMRYIVSNYKGKILKISDGSLINSDIIKAISENKNIEEVYLGDFFHKYSLKMSDYICLKDSVKKIYTDSVSDDLKYVFDEVIQYNQTKNLIDYLKYKDIQKETLYISKSVDDDHIDYLKYVGSNTVISVSAGANIFSIIDVLRRNNKQNKVIYFLEDNKREFNYNLSNGNISYENVFVGIGNDNYSLKEYVEYEKILYSFVKGAEDLSPFEKYIYAYDISKRFKSYKEHKKDKTKARNIYSILFNNYMVCVGYSKLFGDLLDKLNVPNCAMPVDVDLAFYKSSAQMKKKYGKVWTNMDLNQKYKLVNEQRSFVPESFGGHSRRLSYICDPKYGIDGLYFGDPTWDNNIEKNYYNHLVMTSDEVLNSRKKFRFDTHACELFYSNSISEFNDKLNKMLNRLINCSKYKMDENLYLKRILFDLLEIIKKLDESFYEKLKNKYNFIKNDKWECKDLYHIPEEIVNSLYDLSYFIVSRSNKVVDGDTIMNAVKNVYDHVYVNGIDDEELDQIRQYNSEVQEVEFESNKFSK